jgi:hypothetical protein
MAICCSNVQWLVVGRNTNLSRVGHQQRAVDETRPVKGAQRCARNDQRQRNVDQHWVELGCVELDGGQS